jgi:hypothetical protein
MAAAMPQMNFALGHKLTIHEIQTLLFLAQGSYAKDVPLEELQLAVGRKPTQKDILIYQLNTAIWSSLVTKLIDSQIHEQIQKLKYKPYRGFPMTIDPGVACMH